MKIDFKKTIDSYKAKHNVFQVLTAAKMQYLMIDGHGEPGNKAYLDAVSTLYPVAYALKFASKAIAKDYVVPPLEGLWWADDWSAYTENRREEWDWTMMIMTPEWIDQSMFATAIDKVADKNLPSINKLQLEEINEGLCVQLLHIGSYSDEGPILKKLHEEFIPDNDYKMTGKHHEIYLGDPRKVAPEKLKTILRQPIEPAK
ncbi:GyrI-like domain-containing protein [Candidatus Saccharibacteria bacterium]|nr:GyrI-like domain-containing protein [Candidatus Saccharibacteria bacterium]MBP9132316.1 GyrI-like domain-containing protein [Candidatus Saccharibacteria bacterium]